MGICGVCGREGGTTENRNCVPMCDECLTQDAFLYQQEVEQDRHDRMDEMAGLGDDA